MPPKRSHPAAAPKPRPAPTARARRLPDIATAIADWFSIAQRPLPWRTSPRNPYHALVSEIMAQQTQIGRVVEYFNRFVARFPTPKALADADESEVLAAWTGLGYYRRARHLHAAAKAIVTEHEGRLPRDAPTLRRLPGVGEYTAGAIASIVFGEREPIVDGNVRRVLLRIEGRRLAGPKAERWAWEQAKSLVDAASDPRRIPALNEGLMELGATICVPSPAMPRCSQCPLATLCVARSRGTQHLIPVADRPPLRTKPVIWCTSIRLSRREGQRTLVLVEPRRSASHRTVGGLWTGLWQVPTIESADGWLSASQALHSLALPKSIQVTVKPVEFVHATTHRDVRFRVWQADVSRDTHEAIGFNLDHSQATWIATEEIQSLALSSPQRRILSGELGHQTPDARRRPERKPKKVEP